MPGQKKLTTQRQSQEKKKKNKSCQAKARAPNSVEVLEYNVSIRQHRQGSYLGSCGPCGDLALTPSGGNWGCVSKVKDLHKVKVGGFDVAVDPTRGHGHGTVGYAPRRHSSRCDFEEDTESCRGSWGASGTRSRRCLWGPKCKAFTLPFIAAEKRILDSLMLLATCSILLTLVAATHSYCFQLVSLLLLILEY